MLSKGILVKLNFFCTQILKKKCKKKLNGETIIKSTYHQWFAKKNILKNAIKIPGGIFHFFLLSYFTYKFIIQKFIIPLFFSSCTFLVILLKLKLLLYFTTYLNKHFYIDKKIKRGLLWYSYFTITIALLHSLYSFIFFHIYTHRIHIVTSIKLERFVIKKYSSLNQNFWDCQTFHEFWISTKKNIA